MGRNNRLCQIKFLLSRHSTCTTFGDGPASNRRSQPLRHALTERGRRHPSNPLRWLPAFP
jgi:hypothetical protein